MVVIFLSFETFGSFRCRTVARLSSKAGAVCTPFEEEIQDRAEIHRSETREWLPASGSDRLDIRTRRVTIVLFPASDSAHGRRTHLSLDYRATAPEDVLV
jgi:hypothetical protein